ncbi:MAG: ABC transporter substrate-binding protein [Magnetococcales bacterium]|nr:ABC transporter substrate-binding protein [Magnetococcales bacterium]
MLRYVLFSMLALFLSSCSDSLQQPETKSAEAATATIALPKGDIAIGVVWNQVWNSENDELFFEGAELAREEINQQGGVLGRMIKTIPTHDLGTESSLGAIQVARKLADTPNLVAVIGHSTSSSAIPASITYEHRGVVFISPSSTQVELTNHNFQYVFRTIPDNREQGARMADYAHEKNYKTFAVLYASDTNSEQVASIFIEESAAEHQASFLYNKMFPENTKDFNYMLSEILAVLDKDPSQKLDAIFFSGLSEQGGVFIQQARRMGVLVPVIGSDGLDSQALWKLSREQAAGTVVPTVFLDTSSNKQHDLFREAFVKRFGKRPGTWAALAYDAIRLLAHAIKEGESIVPFDIATALRYMPKPWPGVTGCHRFSRTGDVTGKKIFIQEMGKNGKFFPLPGQDNPNTCS